jgi:hypothetical protein
MKLLFLLRDRRIETHAFQALFAIEHLHQLALVEPESARIRAKIDDDFLGVKGDLHHGFAGPGARPVTLPGLADGFLERPFQALAMPGEEEKLSLIEPDTAAMVAVIHDHTFAGGDFPQLLSSAMRADQDLLINRVTFPCTDGP